MTQIKNAFDEATLKKIGKGSIYAISSAVIVYFLQLIGMDLQEATGLATSIIMAVIGLIKFLQTADLKKIITGLGLAVGSSLGIYLLEIVPDLDLGSLTPLATAVAAILLNSIKEYKTGK